MKQLLFLLLSALPCFAAQKQNAAPPPPPAPRYDADLYHKDREAVFTDLEFLYWSANEGALDYAQKMNQNTSATEFYAQGKAKTGSYHFDPGFRISAGFFNAPKYWEVFGEYTFLRVHGHNHASAPNQPGLFLTGTWPHVIDSPLTYAKSSLKLTYDVAYVMVDRLFIPNPHLRLRTKAGLGTAWIGQNWNMHYFNGTEESEIHNFWHFGGGGFRGGLSADWYWGKDFYLTGGSSFGCFLGGYHNRSKQTATTQLGAVRNSDYKDVRAAVMMQFFMGLSYQKNLCAISRIEVFAGYELTPWFNLQEVRRSSSGTSLEDAKQTWLSTSLIALQGLTTRITLNF